MFEEQDNQEILLPSVPETFSGSFLYLLNESRPKGNIH
jgi:hypothetical protein